MQTFPLGFGTTTIGEHFSVGATTFLDYTHGFRHPALVIAGAQFLVRVVLESVWGWFG